MNQPQVVLAGHVCIDHNVTEHATYHSWGSTVMYVADYYRNRLGLSAKIITSYGSDFLPYAAEVTLIPDHPERPGTLLYRNIIKPDLRSWYSENTAFADPPELKKDAMAALQKADLYIFAPLLSNYPVEYVKQMMSYLPQDCVKAFCVQGYLRRVGASSLIEPRDFIEAPDLVPLFDVVTLSDEDHPRARKLAESFSKLSERSSVVLTHGPKGASVLTSAGAKLIPTDPVDEDKVVDSVGCGDIFVGSLVYEYCRNRDLVAAVRKAHLAAREKLMALNSAAEVE